MKHNIINTLLLAAFISTSLIACNSEEAFSGGNGNNGGDNGNNGGGIVTSPTDPTDPTDPIDPSEVLANLNGLYYNKDTKQIALIDTEEDYQGFLQNFYDIDEEGTPNLHIVEGLDVNAKNSATSTTTTTWTFDNNTLTTSGQVLTLSEDGETLSVTNEDDHIVSNPDGAEPVLQRQPDSLPLSDLAVNLVKDINDTTWTINTDGSFRMNLRGKCIFTGTLEESGKGYYVAKDAFLTGTECKGVDEDGKVLYDYKVGEYTTKFYSFGTTDDDGAALTYVATISTHNTYGVTQRPIFSVLMVRSPKDEMDGVYYANRYKELKDNPSIDCNYSDYCENNANIAIDGTYGQIVFIDVKKEPYNVMIHKAVAGAPNMPDEPLFQVIAMKATHPKDSEGNDVPNILEAQEYYIGPSLGATYGEPAVPKSGDIRIILNKAEEGNTVNVKIDGAYLFDPSRGQLKANGNPLTQTEIDSGKVVKSLPPDGPEFLYQSPYSIDDLLLPDVIDRSGVVWRLNRPGLDGSGMTFWAKSYPGASPGSTLSCTLTPEQSAVSGTVTNKNNVYFVDNTSKSAQDPTQNLITNIYGFTAESGDIYLTTSVIAENLDSFPLVIGGGLNTESTDRCP